MHRKLVGDLYEWAGELRTTETQAMGTGVAHCCPEFIEAFSKEVFGGIAAPADPAIMPSAPKHRA
ncbi:hypothetical protein G6N77_15785 [Arthrobacter silviterrae]|uniref:Uncharacterized protein n=1 Tax=Arthrobacter silviterrae TaxID=2026658 RepID=A0ABX0DKZ8_9MICC|nr:hypothetical protein [Arthrobacter silviterrae]